MIVGAMPNIVVPREIFAVGGDRGSRHRSGRQGCLSASLANTLTFYSLSLRSINFCSPREAERAQRESWNETLRIFSLGLIHRGSPRMKTKASGPDRLPRQKMHHQIAQTSSRLSPVQTSPKVAERSRVWVRSSKQTRSRAQRRCRYRY